MRLLPTIALAVLLSGLAGCGPNEPRAGKVLALAGDPQRGRVLYGQTCAACHKVSDAWPITLWLYRPVGFVSTLIDGVPRTKMPSFAAWTDQQLADVHAYVRALK